MNGSPDRVQLLAFAIRCMNAGVSFADLKLPATNEPRPVTPENIEALAAKYVDELMPPNPHPASLAVLLCQTLGVDPVTTAALFIRVAPNNLVQVDVTSHMLQGGQMLQVLRQYELKERLQSQPAK